MPLPSSVYTIGTPFIELQSVDSTNNYALARAHAGLAQHGAAFFAHEQTAGRGQREKYWASEKDANIILSLILKPDKLQLHQQFQLSACIAVAVHDFFSKYAGAESKIKWPNDLYWRYRKAAGILIENSVSTAQLAIGLASGESNWQWAIIGIGININQTTFPEALQNPVSLKQICGKTFDTVQMAKELCRIIDIYYHQLLKGGFQNILDLYNRQLYKKDEVVKLKKGNRIFEATIKAVSATGQLITQHAIEERFDFGEVEWVI